MPNLVGFVTVRYEYLILFSIQCGSFACIKCRALTRFEPEPNVARDIRHYMHVMCRDGVSTTTSFFRIFYNNNNNYYYY
jgi:hypothetical protein